MKKIILIVFVAMAAFLMTSCNKTQKNQVEDMLCPVVVFAKSNESYAEKYNTLVLQGGDGEILQLNCSQEFASTLYDTFEVGDTIISCNKQAQLIVIDAHAPVEKN